ncbi:MAG: hypothetical protein FJX18_05700 [Alphaproteobacteria bacterium]|nr:hypothetical protein [Alphaproteobacteria bacterium]
MNRLLLLVCILGITACDQTTKPYLTLKDAPDLDHKPPITREKIKAELAVMQASTSNKEGIHGS